MSRSRENNPTNDGLTDLIQLANELKLTVLAQKLQESLQQAEQQMPSFSEFIQQLLRTEINARKERRVNRLIKRANIGKVTGLKGFDFDARPKLDPRVIKELCKCQYLKQYRNLLLFGRPGTGKTRIGKTLAHAACLAGYSVLCVNTAAMIEELHASHVDGSFKRFFKKYTKPQLLFLDEFGYEPFSAKDTNYLFRIVSARYETGSIILTANVGFSYWKNLFPSEVMAVATVDRLVDNATILRFTGKSFRQPREIIGAPLEDEVKDVPLLRKDMSPEKSFTF